MLFGDIIERGMKRNPLGEAVRLGADAIDYVGLAGCIERAASAFLRHDMKAGERVAVYLPKSITSVTAYFGVARAGGVFVPVNPVLKARQVHHILADSGASLLVTSADRLAMLEQDGAALPVGVRRVILDSEWDEFLALGADGAIGHPAPDDLAALLYTSGSTGSPKGVMLSHRNLTTGAHSVATYLRNSRDDRILCALPLSFDYGLSQLSTALLTGATAVLINHLFPQDIVAALEREAITGLACVPPLWLQVLALEWPECVNVTLRYVTNSGGRMPRHAIAALRQRAPRTKIFLMYGLTEAFRSTYLDPAQVGRRPDSIGKAIPHAVIDVIDAAGQSAAPGVPGELVHSGPLVAKGYWNDPERTSERFRPLPPSFGSAEPAVWSGDTVTRDADGYLYFVERHDNMIKTSGYRVSPTEIEDVVYETPGVAEAVAVGVPHSVLGQAIVCLVCLSDEDEASSDDVLARCRSQLPAYMVPKAVIVRDSLPRNPNGKIDRNGLAVELAGMFGPAV
ncbi:acyl-CoA ligase (AMP-forming), exosortase A system-associated [Emcibacter sp. SYSU 3D8]|uniref:acyl-CoA ligase (AMP-forming), exosortase A system-associated n=1 Tax=Emcibacter sp. SYSU 3D8 TaxID=3133969 RepID=UPI0031FEE1F8